jgi:hypothetical protein
MYTYHSQINVTQIAQVVDLSCLLVPVIFEPAVIALDGRVVFFAEENVFKSG